MLRIFYLYGLQNKTIPTYFGSFQKLDWFILEEVEIS